MRLFRKSIADFIWECVFALAALKWRKTVPPAKPYSQSDAVVTSITKLKEGAGR